MVEINEALRKYVEELDRRNVVFEFSEGGEELTDEDLERLLGFGVVIPYADALSFDGKGILLVGEGGTGKTPIVKRFAELYPERAKVLAQDTPVIYQSQTDVQPVVYLDDIRSADVPFFAPFLHPGSAEEFPVQYLFHLKEGVGVSIRKGDISEAINFMMFEGGQYTRTPENQERLREMFTQVKCYELLKPKGYGQIFDSNQDKHLDQMVSSLKNIL